MRGGDLIREARKRAGLSQAELAEMLRTSQPLIARWEGGKTAPSFERVVEAIRACGFDLSTRIVARDDDHRLLIEEALRLSPSQRLERIASSKRSVEAMQSAARSK